MKNIKLLINSKTSGKFHRETIDGRSHIVTQMMPVRGDTTMNNIFYPDKDVEHSFMQLNMLPAPSGHPVVNGVNVLASHPVANNKQNIGGFLRNPRKKGKRVFVDFMLDEEIANNSDDGKETIRRIEAGEKIGVSTGLGIKQVINKTGTDDFNVKYTRVGSGFNFDHVAILLNEEAAGSHAGTELITNSSECEILVHNAEWASNELSVRDLTDKLDDLINTNLTNVYTWVRDVFPDSKTFIYSIEQDKQTRKYYKQTYAIDQNDEVSLIDDKVEVVENPDRFVVKQITNQKKEVSDMDKSKVVLAIIGNSANKFTINDVEALNAKTDEELNSIIATNQLDEKQAKDFLTTNNQIDFAGYEEFQTNKAEFELFQANKAAATKVVVDNIVANSDFTAEMLVGKSDDELNAINALLTPEKIAVRIGEQHQEIQINSANAAVNYDA